MERLLNGMADKPVMPIIRAASKNRATAEGAKIKDCQFETAVCERLAAYEDTGLTPEEIKAPFTEDTMINLAAQEMGVEPSRIRELAEADKDRRLVMLPCKVGDTVYFALLGRIIEKQVFSIVSFSNSTIRTGA